MKTGLLIGRFQPLQLGHVKMIEKILSEVDFLKIGIGSSQYNFTKENPFTYEERKDMIECSISGNYEIKSIPDIHNEVKWVDYVVNIVGDFDV